jgi:pimeloyl-ACP methyl ester carboxylesterase
MVLSGSRADADTWDRRRIREEQITELRDGRIPVGAEPDVLLEHLAKAQEGIRDRLDLTGVVASFGGPVLVCVGDRDETISVEASQQLASTALEGTLEVFEGAGHFPSLDQPARFNEVLLDFLSAWKT